MSRPEHETWDQVMHDGHRASDQYEAASPKSGRSYGYRDGHLAVYRAGGDHLYTVEIPDDDLRFVARLLSENARAVRNRIVVDPAHTNLFYTVKFGHVMFLFDNSGNGDGEHVERVAQRPDADWQNTVPWFDPIGWSARCQLLYQLMEDPKEEARPRLGQQELLNTIATQVAQ